MKPDRTALLFGSLLVLTAVPPLSAEAQTGSAQPTPVNPAPSAETSVSVPRKVLERYVGNYELNGTVATVSVTDDGRLTVRLAGRPAGPPLRADRKSVV